MFVILLDGSHGIRVKLSEASQQDDCQGSVSSNHGDSSEGTGRSNDPRSHGLQVIEEQTQSCSLRDPTDADASCKGFYLEGLLGGWVCEYVLQINRDMSSNELHPLCHPLYPEDPS